MEATKYIAKKDFLVIKQGDILNIHTKCGTITISVERLTKRVFYGNEKGKWGKDNIHKKGIDNLFMFSESIENFYDVLEFKMVGWEYDKNILPTDELPKRIDNRDINIFKQKCINDLILIGLI